MSTVMIRLLTCLLLCVSQISCIHGSNPLKVNDMKSKKVLVAFFSRADENYEVGYIEKGNTQIVGEMIAGLMQGELFHIETVTPYAKDYDTCVDQAKKEKNSNVRPEIKGDIQVEDYDVIFLGYPNWWGDMPMAVYTFIEKHNWQGKVVIPFCTHEGSGLSGTPKKIEMACQGAIVKNGLAMRGTIAQNAQAEAQKKVQTWLNGLGL